MKIRTIAIVGPTACGKTKFAIEAAKALNGEIISCDSMQLYKRMDIGSAKPTAAERAQVPHHLIDIIDPHESFSVAAYRRLAGEAIEDVAARGKLPVLCGGTGLYLNSLVYDMDFGGVPQNAELRKRLQQEAERLGPKALHERLAALDGSAASRIHPHNVKKIIRAIEAAEAQSSIGDFSACLQKSSSYEVIIVVLTRERAELYMRIDERVDELVRLGLFEEVKGLMADGLTAEDISMKGIGYKEIIGFYNGEYSREEAVELIKKNTRHYAKRQLTWFKRYEDAHRIDITQAGSDEAAAEEMLTWLRNRLGYTTRATSRTTS